MDTQLNAPANTSGPRSDHFWLLELRVSYEPVRIFARALAWPLDFAGLWPFRPRPNPVAHYPPQSTPTLQERRQIFKRLWVKQISCHSADTFSRPRNRNLRSLRGLDHAEYRLDDVLARRVESFTSRRTQFALHLFLRTRFGRGCCRFGRGAAASAGTGASWCFCRPVAMCGSMPIFSNSSTASLLK